jgi:putative transposase
VNQDGEVVDVYLQLKRDGAAAKLLYCRLLKRHGKEARKIVTDRLRSYDVARRELIPVTRRSTEVYENSPAEQYLAAYVRFVGTHAEYDKIDVAVI